jgi:hypothetical protein
MGFYRIWKALPVSWHKDGVRAISWFAALFKMILFSYQSTVLRLMRSEALTRPHSPKRLTVASGTFSSPASGWGVAEGIEGGDKELQEGCGLFVDNFRVWG